eukprot:c9861_g1_i1.p1 GENE.c9861_g1_i1~~c9861_g1_i1.p1  ORF type:complete len:972 (-),score=152.46 c9861_g1_i1:95-3010(-)
MFGETLQWSVGRQGANESRCVVEHKGALHALAMSHDGGVVVSAGDDRSVVVYQRDPNTNAIIKRAKWFCHSAAVWNVALLGTDFIATCSDEPVCKLWTLSGKFVRSFSGHGGRHVRGLSLTQNQSNVFVATGGDDCDVRVWRCSAEWLQTLATSSNAQWSTSMMGTPACSEPSKPVRISSIAWFGHIVLVGTDGGGTLYAVDSCQVTSNDAWRPVLTVPTRMICGVVLLCEVPPIEDQGASCTGVLMCVEGPAVIISLQWTTSTDGTHWIKCEVVHEIVAHTQRVAHLWGLAFGSHASFHMGFATAGADRNTGIVLKLWGVTQSESDNVTLVKCFGALNIAGQMPTAISVVWSPTMGMWRGAFGDAGGGLHAFEIATHADSAHPEITCVAALRTHAKQPVTWVSVEEDESAEGVLLVVSTAGADGCACVYHLSPSANALQCVAEQKTPVSVPLGQRKVGADASTELAFGVMGAEIYVWQVGEEDGVVVDRVPYVGARATRPMSLVCSLQETKVAYSHPRNGLVVVCPKVREDRGTSLQTRGHGRIVTCGAVLPGSTIFVTGSEDTTVKTHRLCASGIIQCRTTHYGHRAAVRCVCTYEMNQRECLVWSGGSQETLRCWHISTDTGEVTAMGHRYGRIVSRVRAGRPLKAIESNLDYRYLCMAVVPTGDTRFAVVCGTSGGGVAVHDSEPSAGRLGHLHHFTAQGPPHGVDQETVLCMSSTRVSDSTLLICGTSKGSLSVSLVQFESTEGAKVFRLIELVCVDATHPSGVNAVCAATMSDGDSIRIVTAGDDEALTFFEFKVGPPASHAPCLEWSTEAPISSSSDPPIMGLHLLAMTRVCGVHCAGIRSVHFLDAACVRLFSVGMDQRLRVLEWPHGPRRCQSRAADLIRPRFQKQHLAVGGATSLVDCHLAFWGCHHCDCAKGLAVGEAMCVDVMHVCGACVAPSLSPGSVSVFIFGNGLQLVQFPQPPSI